MVTSPKSLLTPGRLALGALALGVAAAGATAVTVYLQREAIGVRLAFDYLRAHGVPAVIRLDRLDLGGASGAVTLGPAARPDLSVGRAEVQFGALPAPWRGVKPPPVRSLTLVRPVLRARWRDGRLDFGSLQPLVDQALHAKPSGEPAPDLHLRDGQLLLDTPAGALTIAVDADLEGGRVRELHARLEPASLSALGVSVAEVQGVLSGQTTGMGGLHLTGALSAARGRSAGRRGPAGLASGLTLTLEALAPNGQAAGTRAGASPSRPLDVAVRVRADRLALQPRTGGPVRVQGGELALDLDGQVDAQDAFAGRLHASGHAARLGQGAAELQAVALQLSSTDAHARAGRDGGLQAQGPFALQLSSGGGSAQVQGLALALAPTRLTASGRLQLDGRAQAVSAAGAVTAGVALPGREAEALARRLAGGVDPALAAPLARAMQRIQLDAPAYRLDYRSGQGGELHLARGLDLRTIGGGASLRPQGTAAVARFDRQGDLSGAMTVRLKVQGLPSVDADLPRLERTAGGAVAATGAVGLQGSAGPVRDGALHLSGALAGADGRWRFAAADCLSLSAAAISTPGAAPAGAQSLATGVRARACPLGPEPLLQWDRGLWRVSAAVRDVAAVLPGAAVAVQVPAATTVALEGRGQAVDGTVRLATVALQDQAPRPRLRPLQAGGTLQFRGEALQGALAIALQKGATPLASLGFQLDRARRSGSASLDTGLIRFADKGLQPGDISPAATALVPQASGAVRVEARYGWSPAGATSSGLLSLQDFGFKSPAGRLDGVAGAVRLTSLSPLASAPAQRLTAERLETTIPIGDLAAVFTLSPDRLELQSASAEVAGGEVRLDPLRLALPATHPAVRSVIRLRGIELQRIVDALNLSNSVKLQARVNGDLPFSLAPAAPGADAEVLRLAQGRIYADGPGRLSIARQALAGGVATAGAAGAQPNAVQDFAYQALEDLAFTTLEASVASRPAGRLGVVFHVVGRHDPTLDRPTRIGLLALLRGHAFDKPLPLPKGTPVDLTLDTSLNLDDILNSSLHLGGAAKGSGPVQP